MRPLYQIFRFISSKALTAWMVFLFVLYYMTVSVWFGEAFARYIGYISNTIIGRSVYIIFFLNILFRTVITVKKQGLMNVRQILRVPLYLGFLLFLLSSFLSLNLREVRWMMLGEGDNISLPWDENGYYRVMSIEPAIKTDLIRTEGSRVFDYEPHVNLLNLRSGERYRVGAFPVRKVGASYMHILNFGIAPVLELRDDLRVLASGPVALRLIPFGGVDSFELRELKYKFYLHVIPNRIIRKGGEVARRYDMKHPRYQIQIVKGDKTVYDGEAEDEITFDGKLLRFFSPIYWVQVECVHDPAYPFYIASLFTLISGVILFPVSFLFRSRLPDRI